MSGKHISQANDATILALWNKFKIEAVSILATNPELKLTDTNLGVFTKFVQLGSSEFDIIIKDGEVLTNAINLNVDSYHEYSAGRHADIGSNEGNGHFFYVNDNEVFSIDYKGILKHLYSPVYKDNSAAIAGGLVTGNFYHDHTSTLKIASTSPIALRNTTQLKITNGDSISSGIEPDILLIDTGIIIADKSVTPLEIVIPSNYIPVGGILNNLRNTIMGVQISNSEDSSLLFSTGVPGINNLLAPALPNECYYPGGNIYCLTSVENDTPGFRIIIKCERNNFI